MSHAASNGAADPAADDDDTTDEEEQEEAPEYVPPAKCMRQRGSVSAEAFGGWNRRVAFQPPTHAKSPEDFAALQSVLSGSFLFNALEPGDLQTVVMAMRGPIALEDGMRVIQEGDSGDHLYVLMDGVMDCYKVIDGQHLCVKTCQRGDLFGELALMYNCPRAATVVCRGFATLWELDRETFNSIVLDAVVRKRAQYSALLRRVPLFSTLPDTQLETLIDALKVERRPQGATIITQGDIGNEFYIVVEGQAVASKYTPESPEPPVQFLHEAGDYFGELALLHNEPRAASVLAVTDVQLLSMDSATFKRLMGPAEDFLLHGADRYN